MKKVIALILGGGQGRRLFPLTMYRSKPAVPIGGKYRLIDIPVSNCLHSNIKDIHVLTQFNSESLNNHINSTYRFDYFSRAFVRILAAEQTIESAVWFHGTADAVRRNISHLNLKGYEDILILSGDQLYEMNYMDLVSFHRKARADLTVSAIPITKREAREFGILKLAKTGRIIGFKEKPKTPLELKGLNFHRTKAASLNAHVNGPRYLASMGVYIFNARILQKVLETKDLDFGLEVIPHSIAKFKSYGYVFDGYWKDVGTIKAFYDANIDLASYKPEFSFFYSGGVFTRPRFLPSARILNSRISHSLIAEGSIINDAEIRNSVVGLRTILGKKCKITRTVLMGADYYEDSNKAEAVRIGIGDGSVIDRTIIDKNARIGKNVIIKNLKNIKNFDGKSYFIRDGIVIIPKKAVIKDGAII